MSFVSISFASSTSSLSSYIALYSQIWHLILVKLLAMLSAYYIFYNCEMVWRFWIQNCEILKSSHSWGSVSLMFQYTFSKNEVIDEAASALERPMEPEMFETSLKVCWRSEHTKRLRAHVSALHVLESPVHLGSMLLWIGDLKILWRIKLKLKELHLRPSSPLKAFRVLTRRAALIPSNLMKAWRHTLWPPVGVQAWMVKQFKVDY